MEKIVIIYGNPVDGFSYIGPVELNSWEAEHITGNVLQGQHWWYAPIVSAEEAIAEDS